jgi:hypothetical protein
LHAVDSDAAQDGAHDVRAAAIRAAGTVAALAHSAENVDIVRSSLRSVDAKPRVAHPSALAALFNARRGVQPMRLAKAILTACTDTNQNV